MRPFFLALLIALTATALPRSVRGDDLGQDIPPAPAAAAGDNAALAQKDNNDKGNNGKGGDKNDKNDKNDKGAPVDKGDKDKNDNGNKPDKTPKPERPDPVTASDVNSGSSNRDSEKAAINALKAEFKVKADDYQKKQKELLNQLKNANAEDRAKIREELKELKAKYKDLREELGDKVADLKPKIDKEALKDGSDRGRPRK